MRGGEDVMVTSFDISPKFTLFWGNKGAKMGVLAEITSKRFVKSFQGCLQVALVSFLFRS